MPSLRAWNHGKAYSLPARQATWNAVRRLAAQYALPLTDCIRYMVPSAEEQAVLLARSAEPPEGLQSLSARLGTHPAGLDILECRGLLHLLTRLCVYDRHLREVADVD
jgi:hypothetical protein